MTFGVGIVLIEGLDFERLHRNFHGHFLDLFVGRVKQRTQCMFDVAVALCSEKDPFAITTILGNQSFVQKRPSVVIQGPVLVGSNDNDIGVLWVCIAPVFYSVSVNMSEGT